MIALAFLLAGCSGTFSIPPQSMIAPSTSTNVSFEGPQAPAIIDRPEGETPALCYVRARNFKGLVPLSCNEAGMVRP